MELKFIFGRAATGKSYECISQMMEELKNSPAKERPIIYIVPEQFSLQSEKNILNRSENKSIIQIQVLSFGRLAYYIFNETGVKTKNILEDSGKAILLRKIIYESAQELHYYENIPHSQNQGFIEKIAQVITEIYQYNLNLDSLIENAAQDEKLRLKLQDIKIIYEKYLQYIGENYISTDEMLDILADKIEFAAYLNDACIWIDEFSSFTPQEYKIIYKLLEKSRQVTIALTVNSAKISYKKIQQTDIFYETKQTILKLCEGAAQKGIKIARPLFLAPKQDRGKSKELLYLEQAYFNPGAVSYGERNRRVKTYGASGRYEEIEFVCDYIISLVRDYGWRYKDIGIITSDLTLYHQLIVPTFTKFDIPYFIDLKTDILSHPLTELIRSAIEIVIRNWSYESVFRYLKTGMTTLKREEIDIIENYVIAYGIKGYKWQQKKWYYGFSGKNAFYDADEIHHIKEAILQSIHPFSFEIDHKKKYTVLFYAEKVFGMLANLKIPEKIQTLYEKAVNEKDHYHMLIHGQIWEKITSLFEKLVDILGDVTMDIVEFSAVLDAGFASIDMGLIPPTQDQVIIGDLLRTRLSHVKAVFIIGANDGLFPMTKSENGIFTDEERAFLRDAGNEMAPDSNRLSLNDRFLIYSAISKPQLLLTISYSMISSDKKVLFPASIISRMEKLFTDAKITDKSAIELSAVKPVFDKMGRIIHLYHTSGEISPEDLALYHWFKNSAKYQELLKKLEKLANDQTEERLDEKIINEIYTDNIRTSVSKIETYVKCPFSFFVSYQLNASERESYGVKSVDLGNIFHYILEQFSLLIQKEGIKWADLTKEQINTYTDIAFEILQEELQNDFFLSDPRAAYILKRAKRISRKSIWALSQHIKRGSFTPYGVEVDFGIKNPLTGMVIEIDDHRRFILTGRIDRIDLLSSDGTTYVKIIDYKSGNKKFDITDIYYGMQLQLLLYMDTLIKNGAKLLHTKESLLPGGILYFKIDDPLIVAENFGKNMDLDEMMLSQFKMSGLILKDEEIVKAFDHDFERYSPVVPVNYTAKGELTGKNALANETDFQGVMNFAVEKVREIGTQMVSGQIHPKPYKYGDTEACKFCSYNAICSFDVQLKKNYQYQMFQKKENMEDIIL